MGLDPAPNIALLGLKSCPRSEDCSERNLGPCSIDLVSAGLEDARSHAAFASYWHGLRLFATLVVG